MLERGERNELIYQLKLESQKTQRPFTHYVSDLGKSGLQFVSIHRNFLPKLAVFLANMGIFLLKYAYY